jgi:hypothetical protein
MLIPLNSIALSWCVAWPILALLKFKRSGQKRDLFQASACLAFMVVLLGGIGILWIPSSIISQKEAAVQAIKEIDASKQQFEDTNGRN